MLKSKHFQNAGRNLKTADIAILGDAIVENAKKGAWEQQAVVVSCSRNK